VFHLIARHQHPVTPLAHAADQLALAAAATRLLARWRDVCAAD
jgi:hypothetical protein